VTVVGEASDGREGVELTARLRPDVVVMDVWLPRLSGIAATAEIHRQTPSAKVIILSVHARADFVEDALCAGALAYVVKTAATQELISAIDAVTHGKKYISPAVAEVLLDRLVHPDEADHGPLATLTPREREILQRVAEGLSAKEIAGDLHISARTVETHRGSIMRKLGVHKTAGLVRLAIREGLLGP
jgi:DNA-binding NarL/FixJ family response regulator